MEHFKIIGYYICEVKKTPKWLEGIGGQMLSVSGFHSFLCNSLQKGLPEVRFNDMGLLENDFHEVLDFARRINGLGEPVEWIPCRVGVYE